MSTAVTNGTSSQPQLTSLEKTSPFPKLAEDDTATTSSVGPPAAPSMTLVEKDKDKDTLVAGRSRKKSDVSGHHKRSISGSLLSRLSFLRSNTASSTGPAADGEKNEGVDADKLYPGRGDVIPESQGKRKRKGSLRKTVLGKNRDRKNSEPKKSPLSSAQTTPVVSPQDESIPTPRVSRESVRTASTDGPQRWPFRTLSKVSIPSIRSSIISVEPASSAASIKSPIVLTTDGSTDDEELLIPRMSIPGAAAAGDGTLRKVPSGSGDSYFPMQEPVRRILSTGRIKSPLASQPQSIAVTPASEVEEWNYSETAFWGYVILIVTWIVFVVGMGSCFDVWSWAWDVGETPSAPDELSDDVTLPIVGYYPALLVLTCIMAWVWVVVAWVGMKYFRHADFRGDDG